MSLLNRLFPRSSEAAPAVAPPPRQEPVLRAPQQPVAASGTALPEPWLTEIGFGNGAQSRVTRLPRATARVAERHATVFACCNNIAGDLSKVPVHVMQRDSKGNEVRVENHPAEYLLNVESAPLVSGTQTRFNLIYAFTLRGNGRAYAPRDGAGELELIEAINPDLCSILRNGRRRWFHFEDGAGIYRRVPAESMVTLRYMALDGWTGRSPIEVAGESFGLALAGQEAAARTAVGGTLRGIIKLDDHYENDEDFRLAAQRVKASVTDPESNGYAVMGTSEDFKSLDLSASDQELLASRKFDREMIAMTYRMPTSKLQILEYGVKANGQQQALDYRTDCLMHWGTMVEAEYALGLLTAEERARGLVLRHDYSVLLQPTTKELYDALGRAVGGPFMTANTAQLVAKLPLTDGPDDNKLNPAANMTRPAGDDSATEGNDE